MKAEAEALRKKEENKRHAQEIRDKKEAEKFAKENQAPSRGGLAAEKARAAQAPEPKATKIFEAEPPADCPDEIEFTAEQKKAIRTRIMACYETNKAKFNSGIPPMTIVEKIAGLFE